MLQQTNSVAAQRQNRITDRLRSEPFLGVQELCGFLGISEATARRDLAELEAKGLLRRTHGGAVPVTQVTVDFSNAERMERHAVEKQRIALVAAALVKDGDVVFLDAGTTTLKVAQALSEREDLTVITNSTDICNHFASARVARLYVVGGEYSDLTHGFFGALTVDAIRRFSVDKAFLSVGAIDMERRTICISLPELAQTQRAMIEIAHQSIVVADHSKFERSALSVTASLDEVDHLITDEATRKILQDLPSHIEQKLLFA